MKFLPLPSVVNVQTAIREPTRVPNSYLVFQSESYMEFWLLETSAERMELFEDFLKGELGIASHVQKTGKGLISCHTKLYHVGAIWCDVLLLHHKAFTRAGASQADCRIEGWHQGGVQGEKVGS